MKLLSKGDDYGFTRGVTLGIVDSIQRGHLRNTGLFANSQWAPYAVSFMKDCPQACFGIDINLVAGRPCADPKDIPDLVDEKGFLIRSTERVRNPLWKTPEGKNSLMTYHDAYIETQAQIKKFIEMVGRKPGYVGGHSLSSPDSARAMADAARDLGCVLVSDLQEKYNIQRIPTSDYSKASKEKVFDPADQLAKNPLAYVLAHSEENLKLEYGIIGGHPGYVDEELLSGITTLSLERVKDAAMWMSPEMDAWIRENNIEELRFDDLY